METWFEQFDYKISPFSPKTVHAKEELAGYEDIVQEVLSLAQQESIIVLEGEYGHGKTTLLRQISRHLGGNKRVVYFAANRLTGRLDVDKLIYERFGKLGKLLRLKSKNMVVAIDEAHYLKQSDIAALYEEFTKGYFKSIVFATPKAKDLALPKKLTKVFSHNVFKLQGPSLDVFKQIVHTRIDDNLPVITDAVIKQVYEKSKGKVRTMLVLLDRVAKYAVENDKKKLTKKDLDKIFASA